MRGNQKTYKQRNRKKDRKGIKGGINLKDFRNCSAVLKEHICVTLGVLVQDVTPLKNEKSLFFFFFFFLLLGPWGWITGSLFSQLRSLTKTTAWPQKWACQHSTGVWPSRSCFFFAATTPLLCLNNSIFVHHALTTQYHILLFIYFSPAQSHMLDRAGQMYLMHLMHGTWSREDAVVFPNTAKYGSGRPHTLGFHRSESSEVSYRAQTSDKSWDLPLGPAQLLATVIFSPHLWQPSKH